MEANFKFGREETETLKKKDLMAPRQKEIFFANMY